MKSLAAPFRISNGRVRTLTSTDQAVSTKILTTLVTNPGERTGLPQFGAGITALLFEPLDELVFSDFRVDAIQELRAQISKVTISDISISPDPAYGETFVKVSVVYNLPLSNPQVLNFRVAIPGELNEESIF
jgi:phage baseplate assembly protein W